MIYCCKGKIFCFLALATMLLFYGNIAYGKTYQNKPVINTVPNPSSTQNKNTNNLNQNFVKKVDTIIQPKIDTFNIKTSKDSLDGTVNYHADDSMVFDVPTKKMILYGKETKVKYVDNELISPFIEFDQNTSIVSAHLIKDSTGKVVSMAIFNQADFNVVADTVRYNMKNGKGITKGTYTKQGEMYVYGTAIKKVSADVFYALGSRFTTCNLDTPHFAFISKKVKFINKKMAITGPVHPEFEGVPVPVVLPFGIYPLKQGRHSGLIAPTFTANAELGLALEGIGYYKVLSDIWDITTRGTIYSYGGWTLNFAPRYYKRYRYQGNFVLDIQKFRNLDGPINTGFNVRWDHNIDTKSRPGVTFRASVNAGSSRFNNFVANSPQRRFNNQLQSTISYSKIWKDKPYNINITANHNQNVNLKYIQITLPNVGFNVNTIYPFRKKDKTADLKWYDNIGIALTSNLNSNSSFYDTLGNIGKQFLDKLQWGARHSVPITLTLPPLKVLQLSPSVSYEESWYQNKTVYTWNATQKKVDTSIRKGLYTARQMSFGLGLATRIFGMIGFKKTSKVQAIRHEIRPLVSFSYQPSFNNKNWKSYQSDTLGNIIDYSVFQNNTVGSAYSNQKFGGLSFSLDNIVQMKVLNKKDTAKGATKKITLIDGLIFNTSYNFLGTSFKLSPISIGFRTNLFEKINIGANAITSPYQTDAKGNFIDKLIWKKKPLTLGTLTQADISLQTSFKGGDKKETQVLPNPNGTSLTNPVSGMPLDEYQQEAAYITNNPGQYANFNIPWSVNFSYSFGVNRQRIDSTTFKHVISQNINGGGSLNLTPKWQIGLNTSYNITLKSLGVLSMYITREMHCWQMSINLSQAKGNSYFNISISPKSGILRDLKINRSRYFYDL